MLKSTEFEISFAKYKLNCQKNVVFIMLMNLKQQTIVCILSFMSRINLILSLNEHKNVL